MDVQLLQQDGARNIVSGYKEVSKVVGESQVSILRLEIVLID